MSGAVFRVVSISQCSENILVFQSCLEGFQEQRGLENLQEHLRVCSRKRTREIELMRELRGGECKEH